MENLILFQIHSKEDEEEKWREKTKNAQATNLIKT
jgi:hypothetical protein